MATITTELVNAWTDKDKLNITSIDVNGLEPQIVAQVLSKLSSKFDVSYWQTTATTPKLVLSVMAMIYAGRTYQETYATDGVDVDSYGTMLIADAESLLNSILDGTSTLSDAGGTIIILPSPNVSSNLSFGFESDWELLSEPKFTMDKDW